MSKAVKVDVINAEVKFLLRSNIQLTLTFDLPAAL